MLPMRSIIFPVDIVSSASNISLMRITESHANDNLVVQKMVMAFLFLVSMFRCFKIVTYRTTCKDQISFYFIFKSHTQFHRTFLLPCCETASAITLAESEHLEGASNKRDHGQKSSVQSHLAGNCSKTQKLDSTRQCQRRKQSSKTYFKRSWEWLQPFISS